MRAVIQRVLEASVRFEKQLVKINQGLLVFVAAKRDDTLDDLNYLAKKILNLRIFPDAKGFMNKSITEEKAEILVISQFTLYARTRKGNRPSFIDAAEPKVAEQLYEGFVTKLTESNIPIKSGKFGADMKISLINYGPVTIIIDSQERKLTRKHNFRG